MVRLRSLLIAILLCGIAVGASATPKPQSSSSDNARIRQLRQELRDAEKAADDAEAEAERVKAASGANPNSNFAVIGGSLMYGVSKTRADNLRRKADRLKSELESLGEEVEEADEPTTTEPSIDDTLNQQMQRFQQLANEAAERDRQRAEELRIQQEAQRQNQYSNRPNSNYNSNSNGSSYNSGTSSNRSGSYGGQSGSGTGQGSYPSTTAQPAPPKQDPHLYATPIPQCVRTYYDRDMYNWMAFQNTCSSTIVVHFQSPGPIWGAMEIKAGRHDSIGYNFDAVQKAGGVTYQVCPEGYVPVDSDGHAQIRIKGGYRCKKE